MTVTTTRTDIPGQPPAPVAEAIAAAEVGTARDVAAVAARAGLRAVAVGEWPVGEADELPGVAGFIVSSFNPMVVELARRALGSVYGSAPLPEEIGADTAVIVVSAYGDAVSARAVAEAVDGGHRVGPLMFFQSVPNAVAGYVAAQWGLTGPVVAVSPADAGAALGAGVDVARLLIADGDAARALVITVEQGVGAATDSGLAVLLEQAREQER